MPQQISHPISPIAQLTKRLVRTGFKTALQRKLLLFSGLVVVAVTVLYFARPVAASNVVWDGGGLTENWSEDDNWLGNVRPGVGDVAVFDNTSSKNATIDISFNVQGIQIDTTYGGFITQTAGTTLNVGGLGYVQNGGAGFSINVSGTATFAISSTFSMSGGTFNAFGGTLVFNDNQITLTGGRFIAPTGTMTFAQGGSNQFSRTAPATFEHSGGTVIISGNSQVSWHINGLGTGGTDVFNNLTINAITGLNIDNLDTLQVLGALALTNGSVGNSGTLQAENAVSIASTFDGGTATLLIVGPPRTVTIPTGMSGQFLPTTLNSSGSILNSSGPGTITTARLNLMLGTIESGASDWVVNISYTQSAGTFTGGTGSLAFNISANFNLTGGVFNGPNTINFNDNTIILTGGQFVAPAGTMSFLQGSSNQFSRFAPATFAPGGTVLVSASAQLSWHIEAIGTAGTDVLNNLTVNTTSGINLDTGDTLRITGSLALTNGFINTGIFQPEGDVSIGGAFDGGNALLTFAGGVNQTFTNSGGVNPSGTWTINKPAGFLTLASDLTLQSTQQLNITSGIFSQGASFNLSAGPIAIGPAGKLTNQGSGDLTLAGNISNAGSISLNGGGGSCGNPDSILIKSLPDGTQRTWSGAGNFFLTDVDVKDQAAANPPVITVFNGTDQPPGGPSSNSNFNFVASCNPTAASGRISGRITTPDGVPVSGAVIVLSGSQTRKTITDANGNYQFDEVGAGGFYTVIPSRVNYSFNPGTRSFSQLGERSEAVFTALPTGGEANPLDTPEYFVRQHYLDFLGREPDESGFNFWSDQITSCGSDFACVERRRINVSAAYFLSIEFQQTGGLVDGLYRASYGRRPLYGEFIPDAASIAQNVIVGRGEWQQQLTTNKAAFIDAFVQRAAFRSVYDNLTDDSYVNTLIANTEVNYSQSERDALVNGLTGGTLTRAEVLRQVVENGRFISAKLNQAFVLMQYFGYLRRDPDESGYQFWLAKLDEFEGHFERAEMVKAFIVSTEYRQRFGP